MVRERGILVILSIGSISFCPDHCKPEIKPGCDSYNAWMKDPEWEQAKLQRKIHRIMEQRHDIDRESHRRKASGKPRKAVLPG